jgi:hypothetical protein
MRYPMLHKHSAKHHDLFGYAVAMTILCLLVSWGVELLLKASFSV